jgi:hypothetical protein
MGAILVIIMTMDPASFVVNHYLASTGIFVAAILLLMVFSTTASVLEHAGVTVMVAAVIGGFLWFMGTSFYIGGNITLVVTLAVSFFMLEGLDSREFERDLRDRERAARLRYRYN